MKEMIKAVMLGHAVADALGVPAEFKSRQELDLCPVTEMTGYGSHSVPRGCWSDDTSMSLATLDSLKRGRVDYEDIMKGFADWYLRGRYTATGEVFDIGISCRSAIDRYLRMKVGSATECGDSGEYSNGNGSLMRIHPVALYLYYRGMTDARGIEVIHKASSLTHSHPRSLVGCGIYSFVLWELLEGGEATAAVKRGLVKAARHYENESELSHYSKRLYRRIAGIDLRGLPSGDEPLERDEIKSSGYVVDSLEAALWCLLTTDSYPECALKAVNLGEDTDTVAAIAGGLAGAVYGLGGIPTHWLDALLEREGIESICEAAASAWSEG